jgi:hypothetical protein
MTAQAISTGTRERSGRQWLRVFVVGLLLWAATVVVTFATDNTNLVPTVILLGSFLVPVAFATYAFGRADQVVTAQRIFAAFVYGSVLGVLGASVLESAFLTQPSVAATYLGVGLTLLLTATQVQWLLIRMGRVPQPTQVQVHTFTMINWALLLGDALVGVVILRGRWRQALALEHA